MRTFVALELPLAFADEVAGLCRVLSELIEGRFVHDGSHHLTLAFLGEVDERECRLAMEAMDAACAGMGPIALRATGLGTFGRARDATLWLGLEATDELAGIAGRVREELSARGLAFDKKSFLPHVTLARHARLGACDLSGLAFPRPDEAFRVTLFRSILGSMAARYKPLYTHEL